VCAGDDSKTGASLTEARRPNQANHSPKASSPPVGGFRYRWIMPERVRKAPSVKTWRAFDRELWTQLEPFSDALIAYDRARRRAELNLGNPGRTINVPGREATFLHSIWFAHREIAESMDALRNVPAYLNNLPKGLPRRITLYSWARYHTENYFQELYVFQNRAEAFFKQLRRAYRKHASAPVLDHQCGTLINELKRYLEALVKKRGEHVHQIRFDDTGLRVLGFVEHMVAMGGRPQRDRLSFFEDARMEKCYWMRANNAWINRWLNSAAIALAPILIANDGTFRFPFTPVGRGPASEPKRSYKS